MIAVAGGAAAYPSPVAGVTEGISTAAAAHAQRGDGPVGGHLPAVGQDDLDGTVYQHGPLIGQGDLAPDGLRGHVVPR
jgi:hypothetical protein